MAGAGQTWSAFSMGRDKYGRWLYAPAGTPITTSEGEQIGELRSAGVQLVPIDAWWVGWWWEDQTITIEIATPATIEDHEVTYTDLEIDLWANREGEHGIVDLEEYDASRSAGRISDDDDRHVQAVVGDLDRRLARSVEPFGDVGWDWLSGATRNQVRVVSYDPDWPRRFEAAGEEIRPLLPDGSRVEHVGSTAVPGLAAKDIVDIAVVVPRLDDLELVVERLEAVGYQARRAAFDDDPGHVFLRMMHAGRRSQHVHLYVDHNVNLIGVVAVRDLLRADPDARQRYQDVKLALAGAEPYDLGAYIEGKSDTVQQLLETAIAHTSTATATFGPSANEAATQRSSPPSQADSSSKHVH